MSTLSIEIERERERERFAKKNNSIIEQSVSWLFSITSVPVKACHGKDSVVLGLFDPNLNRYSCP
jgi:hypothetical protein